MASLNITTNKTRAQMVTELTNWADATKVSGSDYVWACADTINVTATIDISGFTLMFANDKIIQSNTGGTITVSSDIFSTYTRRTFIYFIHTAAVRRPFEIVIGTGRWVGKGITFTLNGGDLGIDSASSITNIADVDIIGISTAYATEARIGVAPTGEVNLLSVTGCSLRFRTGSTYGKISMNPDGRGFISGDKLNSCKLLVNSTTIDGFVVQSSSARKFSVQPYTGSTYTLVFKDGSVNPDFLVGYPQASSAICNLERTITLKPIDNSKQNISGFKYRVSSKRVVNPGGTETDNQTIVTNQSGDYNSTYVLRVWNGIRPTGGGTYNPFRDQIIDKDMRIQYRKYRLEEATFSSNSYNFAVDAPAIMQVDEFIQSSTTPSSENTTTAAQFYDVIRGLVSFGFNLPEDLLTTDGETLTIKSDWFLSEGTGPGSSIDATIKTIYLGSTCYLGSMNTGKFRYSKISGAVRDNMSTHTNLAFARTDGKANLVMNITCPAGSKDPVVAIWPFSQGLDNRANLITGQTTGTGVRNVTLLVDATVKYYCIAKALGANLYRPFSIDPVGGLGGSKDITLFVYEKNDGTPLFPDTLTPAQTAVADTLDFHGTHIDVKIPTDFASNPRWSATDKIWQYTVDDFIAIAYKLDVIQTALTLSVARNQLIFMEEGRLLISAAADDKILEQDPANKTTVSSTTNVKVSFTTISIGRIGDIDARNTFIDDVNGTIDVRGGVPINGGFSIADADRLVIVETKANETHQRLALDSTKPLTSKPDGGITSTGIAITATELADGSVVQTRGT